MLAGPADQATLKATDFGLSVFFKEGEQFRDIVGSAYYVAPEVRDSRAVEAVFGARTNDLNLWLLTQLVAHLR